MTGFLRQSTASQTRTIGPFVDDTDFKTLENALTIANTDILLKKNGAASAAKNSGGATADGSGGMYHLTFDATDTGTVGEIFGSVKVAGALVVVFKYTVLEEAVYDDLFAASAAGYLKPSGTLANVTNVTNNVNAVLANSVAHGGPAATLELGASGATAPFKVTNSGGDAVQFWCTGGFSNGLSLLGTNGIGLFVSGGTFGTGAYFTGSTGFQIAGGNLGLTITSSETAGVACSITSNENVALRVTSNSATDAAVRFSNSVGIGLTLDGPTADVKLTNSLAPTLQAAILTANAITSTVLDSTAVTEIQTGLSTLTETNIRTAVGLATANLDTQLDDILAASGGGGGSGVVPLMRLWNLQTLH